MVGKDIRLAKCEEKNGKYVKFQDMYENQRRKFNN